MPGRPSFATKTTFVSQHLKIWPLIIISLVLKQTSPTRPLSSQSALEQATHAADSLRAEISAMHQQHQHEMQCANDETMQWRQRALESEAALEGVCAERDEARTEGDIARHEMRMTQVRRFIC